jgi:hypothetical protein
MPEQIHMSFAGVQGELYAVTWAGVQSVEEVTNATLVLQPFTPTVKGFKARSFPFSDSNSDGLPTVHRAVFPRFEAKYSFLAENVS